MNKFELGVRLRCKITGLTGIAIGRLQYINGCTQYGLKMPIDPKEPGKYPDNVYIDEAQLDYVDAGVYVEAKPVGGKESFIKQTI